MLHNQVEAEIAVQRGKTPPTGPLGLTTENATVVSDWSTAAGMGVYPGNPLLPSSSHHKLQTSKLHIWFFLPLTGFALAALLSYTNLNISLNGSFEELRRRHNDSENRIFQLFSRVVSVVVSNPSTESLSRPVDITLRHLQVREYTNTNTNTNTSRRDHPKLTQNN